MNIHEHQAKQILKKYGATVPEGVFAITVDELIEKEGWKGGWDNIKHLMKKGHHPEAGAQRLNNLIRKHKCVPNNLHKDAEYPHGLAASHEMIQNNSELLP